MPYVTRNGAGEISGIFANQQDFTSEYLPDDHKDVIAFDSPKPLEIEALGGVRMPVASGDLGDRLDALTARVTALEAKAG